ncbi:MAG: cytochrome c oxidase subunit [Gaiellaceae bacterium]|nr:cytochrome c oxidase subunit [Gaiellaceae bacterium]
MTAYAVKQARPNGWWGMAIFVATEATLFGTMVGTYVYLRILNAHWPPPNVAKPPVLTPTLLTVALVLTSLPMQRAWHAARHGRRSAAWRWILAAVAIQTAYLVWQAHDFRLLVHAMHPSGSAYASVLVTMLAAGHLHVLAGILLNVWLLARIATRLTPYRVAGIQSVTFYWHAVNVISAVVLIVQVSAHL